MSSEETQKVLIAGKLITVADLKAQFDVASITGEKSISRVMETLANAEKPLTRREIANRVKITTGYTAAVLKVLIKKDLALMFSVKGTNNKFYAMTEKGYNAYKAQKKS